MNKKIKMILGYVVFGLYTVIKYTTLILPVLQKAYKTLLEIENKIK